MTRAPSPARVLLLVAAVLSAGGATRALAGPGDGRAAPTAAAPTEEQRAIAKVHFSRGRALREAKDYAGAIAEYDAAYQLFPAPEFLFNLGLVHRLQGNLEPALAYYRRYLEVRPNGSGSDEARANVASIEEQLEKDRKAFATPSSSPEVKTVAAPADAVAVTGAPAPAPRRKWVWGVVGGAAAVVVVAGVGIGLGVGLGQKPMDPMPTAGTFTYQVP